MKTGISSEDKTPAAANFATTRWSLVLRAGEDNTDARFALDELCRIYWYPLYCYVRRRGMPPHDAEDAIQSFFLRLVKKELFRQADPGKGTLRGFLLKGLEFDLIDEHRRTTAEKRGGQAGIIPLDTSGAEERYVAEPLDADSPEKAFERRWALTVLERATDALGALWRKSDKSQLFAALSPFIFSSLDEAKAKSLAAERGMSESNIKVSLHRLRDNFRRLLRTEIAQTVESEAEIDAEIAALRSAVQ